MLPEGLVFHRIIHSMHSRSPNLESAIATSHRQSNFAPAFLFLTRERRKALETLYAVCRTLDDAVDVGAQDPPGFLNAWRQVFVERDARAVEALGQAELAATFL